MAKANVHVHSFNSGEVSTAALARVDIEKLRLCAETQENLFPFAIGKAVMRPGTAYLANTNGNGKSKLLPFVKSVDVTALLELSDGALRVMVNDEIITREAVSASIGNSDFSSTTNELFVAATVTTSTLASGSVAALKDGNVGGGANWAASAIGTMNIDLGLSKTVYSFLMVAEDEATPDTATEFKLYGSSTGAFSGEQVEIFSTSGLSAWAFNEQRMFTVSQPGSYRYYQLYMISGPYGVGDFGINEFRLYDNPWALSYDGQFLNRATSVNIGGLYGGATATFGDGVTLACPNRGGIASIKQAVATSSQNEEHAIRVTIENGPILFKVGSTDGGQEYITETSLDTGSHSLAFTPTSSPFYVNLSSSAERAVKITSVEIESAGAMVIPAPWQQSELREIRNDQSGDIVFLAHGNWKQKKIERRGERSWSVADYDIYDGPFTLSRSAEVSLKPGSTRGVTTLTSDKQFFTADHVGALFKIYHNTYDADFLLGGEGAFTDTVKIDGVGTDNDYTFTRSGTWSGTLTLERSYTDQNAGFKEVQDETTNGTSGTLSGTDSVDEWIRVGFKDGEYTSGTATVKINYPGYGDYGICRVTEYVSSTLANVEVLKNLKNVTYSKDWQEGEWSDSRGWPSAVAFYDGRVWWAKNDRFWSSESDNYYAFNLETEGDAGSIQRSIATGSTFNDTMWILPLQRLVFGTAGAEASARSSSFDEPLTPTNVTVKDASNYGSANIGAVKVDTRGIFVERSRTFLNEIVYDFDTNDYSSKRINILNDDICKSLSGTRMTGFVDTDIVEIALQRKPETYIWVLRDDGVCANFLYDHKQEVSGWFRFITGQSYANASMNYLNSDRVISVATLPGTPEDYVYMVVERRNSGSGGQYHYAIERMRTFGSAVYKSYDVTTQSVITYNGLYQLDSHVVATVASDGVTVSGMSHLAGSTVKAIGPHRTPSGAVTHYAPIGDTYVVSATGEITLSQTTTGSVTVGLPYTGKYKSAKLAYAGDGGTALLQRKKVSQIGILLSEYNADGILIGSDFDDPEAMDSLPRVEDGVEINTETTLPGDYDAEPFPFAGSWDTDARICVKVLPGYSATLNGLVIGIETASK